MLGQCREVSSHLRRHVLGRAAGRLAARRLGAQPVVLGVAKVAELQHLALPRVVQEHVIQLQVGRKWQSNISHEVCTYVRLGTKTRHRRAAVCCLANNRCSHKDSAAVMVWLIEGIRSAPGSGAGTHLDVPVDDAQAVAVVHRDDELLEQLASDVLRQRRPLHSEAAATCNSRRKYKPTEIGSPILSRHNRVQRRHGVVHGKADTRQGVRGCKGVMRCEAVGVTIQALSHCIHSALAGTARQLSMHSDRFSGTST